MRAVRDGKWLGGGLRPSCDQQHKRASPQVSVNSTVCEGEVEPAAGRLLSKANSEEWSAVER